MTKKQPKKTTKNAVGILYNRYVKGHPECEATYEAECQNLAVGQQVYDLRHAVGMTQQELADLVGTTASSICRLESADYEGHSLPMLRKIASALGQRIEIRFVPTGGRSMGGSR
ncbi:MAG: helix-turn-helix domain-containing protein [Planctomycetaceae bacterium]|nr:helix-turn-helix domain-containing protein [Planctomycetaceae bacterium]